MIILVLFTRKFLTVSTFIFYIEYFNYLNYRGINEVNLLKSLVFIGLWLPSSCLAEGHLLILESQYAPFPHPQRAGGHTYQDSLYAFEPHYNDSSIAVFIPEGFEPADTVDMVFYFHGWWNNIRQSIKEFDLLGQFTRSNKKSIFVFPEGPKNAPDSFGGKMEEPGLFKQLVEDVLTQLKRRKLLDDVVPGKIILSGHSGAYRAIAHILHSGGLSGYIKEVYLFDALYGQLDKFEHWISSEEGKLINFITPQGGTRQTSLDFLHELEQKQVSFVTVEGNAVSNSQLRDNHLLFIFSDLGHNEVINPYLQLFLEASVLDPLRIH
jgi:hypothetical protein